MQQEKNVILCVDDDQDVLEFLRVVLEGAGYQVHLAANAEQGVKVFKETRPDLIIVDLMMEEVDSGTSFVTELKANGNQAPIYLLSSAGRELSMMTDASDLGLAGVFQKPLDPERLLKIVNQRLRGSEH